MAPGLVRGHAQRMTYVITGGCGGVKDRACREVCPVDCIQDAGAQFVIDPDECIACGACVTACPVGAIAHRDELRGTDDVSIAFNRAFFAQ